MPADTFTITVPRVLTEGGKTTESPDPVGREKNGLAGNRTPVIAYLAARF